MTECNAVVVTEKEFLFPMVWPLSSLEAISTREYQHQYAFYVTTGDLLFWFSSSFLSASGIISRRVTPTDWYNYYKENTNLGIKLMQFIIDMGIPISLLGYS